jgi:hypothetical protein
MTEEPICAVKPMNWTEKDVVTDTSDTSAFSALKGLFLQKEKCQYSKVTKERWGWIHPVKIC